MIVVEQGYVRRSLRRCSVGSNCLVERHAMWNDVIVDQELESDRRRMRQDVDDIFGVGFVRYFTFFIVHSTRWIILSSRRARACVRCREKRLAYHCAARHATQ